MQKRVWRECVYFYIAPRQSKGQTGLLRGFQPCSSLPNIPLGGRTAGDEDSMVTLIHPMFSCLPLHVWSSVDVPTSVDQG